MPSEIVAQVLEIKDIRPHSDPEVERLELASLGGWQIVCDKGSYSEGDRVVFITPDSLITEKLASILNIRQHLSTVKGENGEFVLNEKGEQMLRVRQAKLRGEPSFGTTIPADVLATEYGINIHEVELGTNLAEQIGILKFEPRMKATAGDADVDNPLFIKYTSIDNIRNYPNVIKDGEDVICTLKIHGTNCRVGVVEGELMAGSHSVKRKEPEDYSTNTYWYPLSLEPVQNLLNSFRKSYKQVILFGEVYGAIQKNYTYDAPNALGFRAFDLFVDGRYLSYPEFHFAMKEFGVPAVPILAKMKYSYDAVVDLAESYDKDPLGNHKMEGIVVRPYDERRDPKIGRVVLKYITNSYLFDKNTKDFLDNSTTYGIEP